MCKKCVLLISLISLLGVVGGAYAADVTWIGDPGDPNAQLSFCDPCGWDGGVAPGPGDDVYINPPPYQGPVVDCHASVANIFGPRNNSDANQVMNIVGGEMGVSYWLLGDSGSGTATVNISGDPTINVLTLEGANSGTTIVNITDAPDINTRGDVLLASPEGSTLIMNISGSPNIRAYGEWRLADNGTAIVNISGNPNIVMSSKWRNGDSENGYIEIHMSGGSLSTGRYLSIYDDGSGIFDFSGGTIEVNGLVFSGRYCSSWGQINVSGTADITAWEAVRLSYGGCGPSTLNISGGRLYCTGYMEMASGTATSTLNMTGGSLVIDGAITVPAAETAKGIVNLDGGTIECRSFSHGGDNWLLDVCGGMMIIDGNAVPEIEADIAVGKITACGGALGYSVIADFNNVNPGKTTIWAESGPLPSDFDGNGTVEWADLKILCQWWLSRCRVGDWCDGCDLNQSGTIDFRDFALFALDWLKTWK